MTLEPLASETDPKPAPLAEEPAARPRRAPGAWAAQTDRVEVRAPHPEARNLNVDGRRTVSPLQGFGQLWQKTFRLPLPGVTRSAPEVMALWKENFGRFQPPENRFYTTLAGIQAGEVLLIEAKVPPLPGAPSILPVATGVLVLYVDETSFTVMNPEGHPLSGWNTFSIEEEDGGLVAQVKEQSRPSDPLYEFFNRFMGSSAQQDKIWFHVLGELGAFLGVAGGSVTQTTLLIDPRVQWRQAGAIWNNAAIRTVFYLLAKPLRRSRT